MAIPTGARRAAPREQREAVARIPLRPRTTRTPAVAAGRTAAGAVWAATPGTRTFRWAGLAALPSRRPRRASRPVLGAAPARSTTRARSPTRAAAVAAVAS